VSTCTAYVEVRTNIMTQVKPQLSGGAAKGLSALRRSLLPGKDAGGGGGGGGKGGAAGGPERRLVGLVALLTLFCVQNTFNCDSQCGPCNISDTRE
jgi:hypothetical protein